MAVTVIGDNTGDDYAGTEDTYMREGSNNNYGTDTFLWPTKYGAGIWRHTLLKFSGLSNISASDTVSAVTLGVYRQAGIGVGTHTITFKRLLVNWVELQAGWNNYATGSAWTSGGGVSDGNDRSATVSDTVAVNATNEYKTLSASQLVTDVQNFVDATWTNYGWHLERTDAANDSTYIEFTSSDGTDGQRPYLSVTHAAGGGATIPVFINHYRNQGIM